MSCVCRQVCAAVVVALVATPALANPCDPDGAGGAWSDVPFVERVRGESLIADLEAPALLVAQSATAGTALARRLGDPAAASAVQQADFGTEVLAAVLDGPKTSAGYGLRIHAVKRRGGAIRLTAARIAPVPGRMTSSVITWPYAVIAIARTSLLPAVPQTRWVVCTDEGALLADHSEAADR